MKSFAVVAGLTLGLAVFSPSWAQNSYAGRITYLDENKREIMLDNHYLYRLPPAVNPKDFQIAQVVRVTAEERNGVATALAVAPATLGSSTP